MNTHIYGEKRGREDREGDSENGLGFSQFCVIVTKCLTSTVYEGKFNLAHGFRSSCSQSCGSTASELVVRQNHGGGACGRTEGRKRPRSR